MSDVKLLLGDCLDEMLGMPDESVDWVFADPPYNVGLKYNSHADSMTKEEYLEWCKAWYVEAKRISRTCVVITPGMVSVPMWIADIERTHSIIAWTKANNNSRNYIGKTSGFQTWEPLLVFGKSKRTILRDSVEIPISLQSDTGSHPCPKPLRLLQWLIPQFTDDGDTVLDPFMGSGTTILAALQMGRNAIGIEKDPQYFGEAQERIQRAQADMGLADKVVNETTIQARII